MPFSRDLIRPFLSFLQDPQNMSLTVIVIRSLVPGGVADRDRRVFPGDRLVYVSTMYSTVPRNKNFAMVL